VWNKDGDRIFFIRDGRVLAMSASSQVSVPVSDAAGPAFDRLLGFPAGGDGRLLTASKLGSDSLAFWLVDVTTGAVDSVSYDVAYLWLRGLSPDRRTIVYSYYVGAGARSRLMLRMLPNEGRPLTDGRWDDTSPAWSPDGKAIYFVSDRPARSN
jgi:Tol biopolymer transport system component